MRSLVLLGLLAGCDKLFDIEYLDLPGGGVTGDGGPSDGNGITPDAMPCPVGPPDEDGDSLRDDCDACPTVPSDSMDIDGDGLPNACDLDYAAGGMDEIEFVALFATGAENTKFTYTGGVTWLSGPDGHGQVTVGNNATMTQIGATTPTRIEIRVAGFVGGEAVPTAFYLSGVDARVHAADCANATMMTKTCLIVEGVDGTLQAPSTSVEILDCYRDGQGSRCKIDDAPGGVGSVTVSTGVGFVNDALFVDTAAGGNVVIKSIVIYGAK